jgi:hypothetical protein
MRVGYVEGCDGSDEELPWSENSHPEEDGDEPGGEGGIPDALTPRIGVSIGLVALLPKGFSGRPMP